MYLKVATVGKSVESRSSATVIPVAVVLNHSVVLKGEWESGSLPYSLWNPPKPYNRRYIHCPTPLKHQEVFANGTACATRTQGVRVSPWSYGALRRLGANPVYNLGFRGLGFRVIYLYMVIFQNRGTPIWTPIYYSPYHRDPKRYP